MIEEGLRLLTPFHEEDTMFTVAGKLVRVHRVELDPMGGTNVLQAKLHGNLGAVFVHVGPVPERARLGDVGAEGGDVAVIGREVHHFDTTGVRLKVGAHRRRRVRVPDDEHGVLACIRRHHPVFVFTAEDASDLIAVTLKQLLLLGNVVVDDAGVGRRVENLRALLIRQKVHTLVNVFIESIHLVEGQGVRGVRLLVRLVHLVVHHLLTVVFLIHFMLLLHVHLLHVVLLLLGVHLPIHFVLGLHHRSVYLNFCLDVV
mmetsp:Transcript_46828/g.61980  ORF Transcript_46828/g.61980 Transcript_46828/m.61980 type:complete len:258 (+) Transcript_46828:6254-7027(+)